MLFRRKSKEKKNTHGSDKMANLIATCIIRLQRTFAGFMQARTAHLSNRRLRLLLLAFCLAGSGWCIYLIADALISPVTAFPAYKVARMHLPGRQNRAMEERLTPEWSISKKDYQNIQLFWKYMDSIRTYDKRSYDSILLNRPGLFDSARKAEELYKQHLSDK